MNICGILVHAHPEGFAAVEQRLLAIPGVEVHGISEEGRAVVTLEEDDEDQMADSMLAIQRLEGVLSASMIYHQREDEEPTKEETMS
ncbi:chaperone NapD [Candidatus Venteria ishoeyi]|uniref:Chaperone NapD n=1 Tax=Candidatus Venteria ishoeyi TaxID=1899563 RepID=A0A1H6F560_9GAMM|nr:chaperone NapD [Candidatus Venteria ishoeyi]MDM8545204.1 chaperone NapD [Candidatus Venteria ishoeyi]SEH04693.1 assembly protein for periplasmic nitrate reductase [Candidatus Venteria ishoeyi]